MENAKEYEIYSNIEPKINNVDELSAVLSNIQLEYEQKEEPFPKEIKIKLSSSEWLSIVRSTKYDQSINLVFNPNNKQSANIVYIDYRWPFKINIFYE